MMEKMRKLLICCVAAMASGLACKSFGAGLGRVARSSDGTIYVAHDHDRGGKAEIWFHRFAEEDVLAKRIVSPRGRLGILVSRGMASRVNSKKTK